MKKIVAAAVSLGLLFTLPALAQTVRNTDKFIKEESGSLIGARIGVRAVRYDGKVIADVDGSGALLPASNTKLITTGCALNALGSDFVMTTKLAMGGEVRDSVLHGDLYIVGGGDPTLGSKDSIALRIQTLFRTWASFLRKAGVKKIDGRIIGDGRFFDGPIECPTWDWEDLGTYYGAGGGGLCFYRNQFDINVAVAGDSVALKPSWPDLPWLDLRNEASVGPAGSGDNLYLFATDLSPVASMRGTFASDRKAKTEECANKFGALTLAHEFRTYLETAGILSEGYSDIDARGRIRSFLEDSRPGECFFGKALPVDSLRVIGSTQSPSIKRIAYVTNHRSDNFYAETLLRTLGREKKGSASYASALAAENEELEALGLDTSHGIHVVDGSGLARHNYIAPEFFCRFLRAMMDCKVFGDYLYTLGQPGKGSYSNRLKDAPDSVKSRIRYKSGSMNGVVCFSGYIEPSDGEKDHTIVFSVMTNNFTGPSWKAYSFIDKVIARLAGEN